MNNPNNALALINSYPETAQQALMRLRSMIFTVAQQENIHDLEETLKWGEPSYVCKTGSTLRMDWKPKSPEHISLFVNCKSKLIETINEVYPSRLETKGQREVVIMLDQPWPEQELLHLISFALRYHKIKHLPLLGA